MVFRQDPEAMWDELVVHLGKNSDQVAARQ
jgi:hypothetical protein